MTFVGGSITTFGDRGRLGTDCWATDSAHPAVLYWLRLDPTLSISSATDPDALELPLVSSSFRRLCSSSASAFFLSFSRAVRLVASLDVTPVLVVVVVSVTLVLVAVVVTLVLVVVAVVNVILLADDEVLFPHAHAPTQTAALIVVALFLF